MRGLTMIVRKGASPHNISCQMRTSRVTSACAFVRKTKQRFLFQKSWFTSNVETCKNEFGFHTSDFSSPQIDALLLERSLRLGCNVFVGSAGRSGIPFERLAEISNIDDVDLSEMVIGNRIKSVEHFEIETQNAVESLCGRSLEFTTIPLRLADVTQQRPSLTPALLSLLSSAEEMGAGQVGVELNTELLRHCVTGEDENVMFKKFPLDSTLTFSPDQLLDFLDHLHAKGLLRVIVCSSNLFTLPVALEVHRWAATKGGQGRGGISFLASEVLRGHPRSPGLLLGPKAASAGIGALPNMEMSEAIEMFQKTLNTCIHFEKQFLNKAQLAHSGEEGGSLPPAFPPLTHLCIGMVLAQAQHTILFPQEWKSIRITQVDPDFEEACKSLKKAAGDEIAEYENFLTVYIPMKRNLVRAFEATINARQELLCNELKASTEDVFPDILRLASKNNSLVAKYNYSSMALHECISKAWAGVLGLHGPQNKREDVEGLFDTVLLQGVEVPAELWGGNKAHSALSDGPSVGGTSQWYLQSLANRLDTEFYANNE